MKCFHGTPENISQPFLGVVQRIEKRDDSSPVHLMRRGSRLALVSGAAKKLIKSRHIVISGMDRDHTIGIGDVVRIDPGGDAAVLFQADRDDNSLVLTNRCNCSCVMCPQVSFDPPNLFEENKRLLSLIPKQTRSLSITGGEPTLKRSELVAILEMCKRLHPAMTVELLSNGVLLSDISYVVDLMMINHPSLLFAIPFYADIDSLHDSIMQHKGAFMRTFEALYHLARFRQNIELRVVIVASNYARLPQLASFIYRNFPFVQRVAFIGLEIEGRARSNLDEVWVDPTDYQDELEQAVTQLHRRGVGVVVYAHQLCVLRKSLWRYSVKAISGWKNVYFDQCRACKVQDLCGGFFVSSRHRSSKGIRAFA